MSTPSRGFEPNRPMSDEELLHAHQQAATETDDRGNYASLPLVLLFFFSGLILFVGTYVGKFSGNFDPIVQVAGAHPAGAGAAAAVDPAVLGKNYFAQTCAACHGPQGQGLPGSGPPLAGSEWVTGSDARLIRIVLHGLSGPITVKGVSYPGSVAMPAQGSLADARIAAILTYIRQDFGNTAAPVAPERVAAIRAEVGTHGNWTAAELQAVP